MRLEVGLGRGFWKNMRGGEGDWGVKARLDTCLRGDYSTSGAIIWDLAQLSRKWSNYRVSGAIISKVEQFGLTP